LVIAIERFFHILKTKNLAEIMRAHLQQLRQELGARLLERVFPSAESAPSKVVNKFSWFLKISIHIPLSFQWWLCFSKRRFMDKQLTQNM